MAKAVERYVAPVALGCVVLIATWSLGAMTWPPLSRWNDRAAEFVRSDSIKIIYYLICFSVSTGVSFLLYFHIVMPSKRRYVYSISFTIITLGATLAIACVGPFQVEQLEANGRIDAAAKGMGANAHADGGFSLKALAGNS